MIFNKKLIEMVRSVFRSGHYSLRLILHQWYQPMTAQLNRDHFGCMCRRFPSRCTFFLTNINHKQQKISLLSFFLACFGLSWLLSVQSAKLKIKSKFIRNYWSSYLELLSYTVLLTAVLSFAGKYNYFIITIIGIIAYNNCI